ncbi:MAG: elongation factor Ts [Candidatus Nomurabacteria bacterium]|nr:elongation factor Ts [Candidatus Nomurabacteria bacterium]
MSDISIDQVKELRDTTGVSIMQCKKALEEAKGDMEKAKVILRKHASNAAMKKSDRELGSGAVRSYIHNDKVGVMLELNCETDFVAKNEDFTKIADDIAMHIAAMAPEFVSADQITDADKVSAKAVFQEEVDKMGDKPDDIKEKILQGKMDDFFGSKTLLDQPFVKNPEITIGKLIEQGTQKLGEKIQLSRFTRFELLG